VFLSFIRYLDLFKDEMIFIHQTVHCRYPTLFLEHVAQTSLNHDDLGPIIPHKNHYSIRINSKAHEPNILTQEDNMKHDRIN